LEDAKVYFQRMGCSGFHMFREDEKLYRQYEALRISRDLEETWRLESISKYLDLFEVEDDDASKLCSIHSGIVDLVLESRSPQFLERLLMATRLAAPRVSKFHRLVMAEQIVGDQSTPMDQKDLALFEATTGHFPFHRAGLIFFAFHSGLHSLAQEYALLARELASTPLTPGDEAEIPLEEFRNGLENRRLELLSDLEAVVASGGDKAALPWLSQLPEIPQEGHIHRLKRFFNSIWGLLRD